MSTILEKLSFAGSFANIYSDYYSQIEIGTLDEETLVKKKNELEELIKGASGKNLTLLLKFKDRFNYEIKYVKKLDRIDNLKSEIPAAKESEQTAEIAIRNYPKLAQINEELDKIEQIINKILNKKFYFPIFFSPNRKKAISDKDFIVNKKHELLWNFAEIKNNFAEIDFDDLKKLFDSLEEKRKILSKKEQELENLISKTQDLKHKIKEIDNEINNQIDKQYKNLRNLLIDDLKTDLEKIKQ